MRKLVLLPLAAAACARSAADFRAPDMLLVNANVHTLDPANPRAQAVAMSRGRIAAVGDEPTARAALPANAQVVDLGGATVLPGLVDAHAHLLSLGEAMVSVNLAGSGTWAEVVDRVKAAAGALPPGKWLVGRGWDQNSWPEGQRDFPTHAALTQAVPDRPVMLERVDGHAVVINAKAMELAGLGPGTQQPAGGRIVRDAAGTPTGVLVDNAIDLVAAKVPPPSPTERERLLLAAAKRCAELGLTAVHDAGTESETWEAYQRLAAAHRIPIRVYAMAAASDPNLAQVIAEGPEVGRYGGRLTRRTVKFVLDGALGSRGAALFESYADDPGNRGLDLEAAADFEMRAANAMLGGFQVAVHAIGDRANATALDVLERTLTATSAKDARPRIEHAQVLRSQDLPRFSKAGIVASMQPTHATSDMRWAARRLGPERVAGAYVWKSLVSSGSRLAFGSDFPVEDPNPLFGIYAAVTRTDADGKPEGGWFAEERLTVEEAVRAFTEGAAFASFTEAELGRVAKGMSADLSVFDRDLFAVKPKDLREAKVVMTIVGGEIVYRR